jgi:hypothetical protein
LQMNLLFSDDLSYINFASKFKFQTHVKLVKT